MLSVGSAIAFWLIGNIAAPHSFANWQMLWTLEPLVLVLAAGFGIVIEIRRWGAAGNARVVRTLMPSQAKELPKAKAVVRRAARSPVGGRPRLRRCRWPAPVAPMRLRRARWRLATASRATAPRFLKCSVDGVGAAGDVRVSGAAG